MKEKNYNIFIFQCERCDEVYRVSEWGWFEHHEPTEKNPVRIEHFTQPCKNCLTSKERKERRIKLVKNQ